MDNNVTKEMTIEEIFSRFPHKSQKLAQEMTNRGLHCVGCGAATWETLEAGMLSHGFNEDDIEDMVMKLNGILAEKMDLSTISMTKRAAEKYKQILKEEGKEDWGFVLEIKQQAAVALNMCSITLKKLKKTIRPLCQRASKSTSNAATFPVCSAPRLILSMA